MRSVPTEANRKGVGACYRSGNELNRRYQYRIRRICDGCKWALKRSAKRARLEDAPLLGVLIDIHVLYAASMEPIGAPRIVEELVGRGYKASNRSVSALLHRFVRRGCVGLPAEVSLTPTRRRKKERDRDAVPVPDRVPPKEDFISEEFTAPRF